MIVSGLVARKTNIYRYSDIPPGVWCGIRLDMGSYSTTELYCGIRVWNFWTVLV